MNIEQQLHDICQVVDYSITYKLARYQGKLDYLKYELVDGKPIFSIIPTGKATDYENHSFRQPIKLGSLLTKVYPELHERQVLSFVEKVVAQIEIDSNLELTVVSGEDIRPAYNILNYVENCRLNLRSSCMSSPSYQLSLDLYIYNPNTFNLLVAYTPDKKVAGRALIYTGYRTRKTALEKKNPYKLFGRVYASSQSVQRILQTWGDNNCSFSFQNSRTHLDKWRRVTWHFPLEHWDLNYYPWMDNNINYIDKSTGILSNRILRDNYIRCEQGSYEEPNKKDQFSKLDPNRPGKIWIRNQWTDESAVVKLQKYYELKANCVNCELCEELESKGSIQTHAITKQKLCHRHKMVYLANIGYLPEEEIDRCSTCNYQKLAIVECPRGCARYQTVNGSAN